jgi:hypothetical protein
LIGSVNVAVPRPATVTVAAESALCNTFTPVTPVVSACATIVTRWSVNETPFSVPEHTAVSVYVIGVPPADPVFRITTNKANNVRRISTSAASSELIFG